ncbi:hypothetical protein L484_004591 [Morus notabilis]|uniref:Uncharacterized protein n=1 Tax=Morus notabilis TaxID=981085 RepID=W9QLT6_9ROSA|nr:hypothetical protein L484_004591 [Morus notabilis]
MRRLKSSLQQRRCAEDKSKALFSARGQCESPHELAKTVGLWPNRALSDCGFFYAPHISLSMSKSL